MFELKVSDSIASAHFIPGYDGPCKDLHGHTWKIEVTIQAEELNDLGLVVDFQEVKRKLKEFLKPLDHVCLNDLEAFKTDKPTTENLARHVYRGFARACAPFKLKKIRVWESDRTSITYYE